MDQRLARLLSATEQLEVLTDEVQFRRVAPHPEDYQREGGYDEYLENHASLLARDRRIVVRATAVLQELVSDFDFTVAGHEWHSEDRAAAAKIVDRFMRSTAVDAVHGLDFVLELRARGELLLRFQALAFFLIAVRGEGWLKREDHGMGYHFHYLALRDQARTDVLLTFDPEEPSPPDCLYWEHHGGRGRHADPAKWRRTRARAVYDAARPSLTKPGKRHFRAPSSSAAVLWPR